MSWRAYLHFVPALAVLAVHVAADVAGGNATVQMAASAAGMAYDPAMTRAFAALSSLAYCASDWKGVPPGLPAAVERSCGVLCEEAGLQVERGSVRFVDLPDMHRQHQLFAISARFQRLASDTARGPVPREGCLLAFRGPIGLPLDPNQVRSGQRGLVDPALPGCPGCRVHQGCQETWAAMENETLAALRGSGCRAEASSALYVTGHSLGGCVAMLAMLTLQARGFDVQLSYTFASPRVGNGYFATAFARAFRRALPVFKVTHATDSVPASPFDGRFKEVPYQVHYPSDSPSDYIVCYDVADAHCGVYGYARSQLAPLEDRRPHDALPLAPYGSFTHLMPFGPFALTPSAQAAYNSVCVNGHALPRAPRDARERHLPLFL